MVPRQNFNLTEGPFVVREAYSGNAYKLVNADGDELGHPWNGLYLKRFYP